MPIGEMKEAEAREALQRYENDVCRHAVRQFAFVRHGALEVDDLKAEGRVAVLEAIASYEDYGVSERTWVWTRMRQRMIDARRRLSALSRGEMQLVRRHAAGELPPELEQKGRLTAARRIQSIEDAGNGGPSLLERFEDTEAESADASVLLKERKEMLREAIDELRPRHAIVLRSRINGLSLRETAGLIGVSESRAAQIQHRATAIVAGKIHAALANASANLEMQPKVPKLETAARPAFRSPSPA